MIKILRFSFVTAFIILLSIKGYSQACVGNQLLLSIKNVSQPTSTTLEYDIFVQNTGSTVIKLSGLTGNVRYPAAMLTAGTLTVVDQPSATGNFPTISNVAPNLAVATQQARWTNTPFALEPNAVVLPLGVDLKFARFRITNTVGPWASDFSAQLTLANGGAGISSNVVTVYCSGNTNSTSINLASTTLLLSNPPPFILNPTICATTGSYTQTPVTCFGNTNGTATITMSPVPSSLSATYSLDSGTPIAVTLSAAGVFTIPNLTAGSHTLIVTGNGTCTTPVSVPFTIGGPSVPLTNTTTITACDSYTWAVTGLTYTTSGPRTGTSVNGSGCTVNETLNLTINNSTAATTTATVCDSYTWALPLGTGLTYTTSQAGITNITTNAAGCPHTQTLNLTINNSTTGTSTITACDSYTWLAPLGNGVTYTTNQTGLTFVSTNAAGCPHTQTLNLTINSSTSGTTTATACDSYIWAAPLGNGLTYTTNQTGITFVSTNAAGCPNTQTLNLTINNSTSATTTATACNSYTWALPLGTGLTYTTSQAGITNITTNAAGCPHTQTLNLTINNSTTGTSTITACDTYTWAAPLGNGLTYTTNQTGVTFVSTNAAGCPHTQTLNLTINNSTSGTTTATACDSYTWAAPLGNGLTYTTNQTGITFVSTNAAGCPHTQTLNLIINNSTAATTTATACNSYTWALPLGTGLTYTTSQAGITNITTNAAGCPHTQTLNLTINNSTTGTSTITACDTYTWAAPLGNGLTYTTNQTGVTFVSTNAAGCPHTQTLNLTINNSTSGTTTATACDTYTWALPLGNGLTYTSSQTGITNVTTNAAGCPNTQTLNLIINNSTTGTTNATACSTYTWAAPLGNGLTYTTNQSGVTFVSTNAAGCPHTQTLNLVFNSTSGTSNITACDSYTWAAPLGNGLTYTTSQTGVTFVSTNAAGCPHTQTLNLTINNSTSGTTTATACDTYTWALPLGNGLTYTTTQTGITHVTTNAAGCPHTQTLNLTINNSTSATTNVTACDNYTWAFPAGNGQTYTSSVSGVIKVSTNAAGCTHTQTLNLTINYNTSGVTNAIACSSYTWALPVGNGVTYTSSVFGVTKVTPNAGGCTHTQTLNLVINNPTSGTTNASACGSYTWAAPLGNGQTYTASQSGITHVSTNASGCTHTQTLNLTINSSTSGTTNATACNTYTWALPLGNGQTYTTSQAAITHVSTNAAGCPHTQTLNLTINNSTSGTTNATACNSYTWALPLGNGQTYTSSVFGVTRITTNAAGCPHTQTLNLVISNSTTGTTNATACNSYTWAAPLGNGQTYTTSQSGITNITTNAAGCTHTQTLNLTINNSTTGITNAVACTSFTWAAPLGNGVTYTSSVSGITNTSVNAAGCQHTQTLNLIINQNTTNGSVTITANNSYTWAANLVTYTTSGTYTHVTTNAGGCVNTATLNLTIISVTGTTWYQDADGDGYGNPAVSIIAVVPPAGYVAIGTDCNDTVAAINPGATEICYDGIDNDCNGIIDNVGLPGGCIAIVTSLTNAFCGVTITNLTTNIKANYVVGAQGYRFRIRNLTTNVVLIKDRPVNYFTFSSLPGITLNTTYTVDIALLINNVWQPFYGAPCNVTVSNPVSTIGAQCGTTLISMNQWIYATYFSSATGYRFRVTNTVTGGVQIKDQTLNRFNFNQLPNRSFGTLYFVEVALRNTDGTYLPYGPGCNITTNSINREGNLDAISNEFKVITYPNPFVENFKFSLKTSSSGSIQIRVYDMLGKQVDNQNVELSEIENIQMGANYPSGVYNVIVSQGDVIQTVRVIKR